MFFFKKTQVNKKIFQLVKITLTIGLLAYLFHILEIEIFELIYQNFSPTDYIIFTVLSFGYIFSYNSRWFYLSKINGLKISFGKLTKIFLMCNFFNLTLPTSIGGDALRVIYLKKEDILTSETISLIIIEKFIALITLSIIATPFLFFYTFLVEKPLAVAPILFIFISSAIFIMGLVLNPSLTTKYILISSFVSRLRQCVVSTFTSVNVLFVHLALASITHLFVFAALIYFCYVIDLKFDYFLLVSLFPSIFILMMVPISYGGHGLRESVFILVLELIGIANQTALNIAMFLGIFLVLTGLPGLFIWCRHKNY